MRASATWLVNTNRDRLRSPGASDQERTASLPRAPRAVTAQAGLRPSPLAQHSSFGPGAFPSAATKSGAVSVSRVATIRAVWVLVDVLVASATSETASTESVSARAG